MTTFKAQQADLLRQTSSEPQSPELLETLQRNWTLEMDGAEMYAALAARERLPRRRAVFAKLSAIERHHAELWAARIVVLGAQVPAYQPGTAHAVRTEQLDMSMQDTIRRIESEERRDVVTYLQQMEECHDEATAVVLREVILDEFAHAHTLQRLYAQSTPRAAFDYLARHQRLGTGSWIGDAIYGVNDGLGAIFGIVSGVSGATLGDSKFVLLAGLAGMIASALSMGSGAYLASKSEREIFHAELERERAALQENPSEAKEELALFHRLKGVPEDAAAQIADYLAARPEQFLRTVAAEKMNLTEDALSNPITAALTGSISTAVGAFIPVVPFFFLHGYPAVMAAAMISLVAHFAVGAAKSIVTVRSWWSSGLEMTAVGTAEGVVTYIVGIGLGHLA